MNFDIQPVQRDQFGDWLRLREAVYSGIDGEFHDQEMELFLGDDTKECFLAITDAGDTCGMVEVSLRNIVDGCLTSPVGYIEGVYVDPKFRGIGIARQLLEKAEDWCRSQGCREMGTDAELHNTDAQCFHQKMGFKETFRIVGYRKDL